MKRPKRKAKTALARRPTRNSSKSKLAVTKKKKNPNPRNLPARVEIQQVAPVIDDVRALKEQWAIADLGLVEVKFTPEEELVLSEPVPQNEIRVKPNGQIYLSHPTYTRWFNRALGRGAWQCVPIGKPTIQQSGGKTSVVIPYVMHIHSKPIAFALGEHEYFEKSPEQTYGDALESTMANALRRVAKRLGVGLELWDREFIDDWMLANVIQVQTLEYDWKSQKNVERDRWRLRNGAKLKGEIDGTRRRADTVTKPRVEEPVARNADANEPITREQVTRFWTIANRAGRDKEDVRKWLLKEYAIVTTAAIKRRDYENIINALNHPGPLQGPARTPGQEG